MSRCSLITLDESVKLDLLKKQHEPGNSFLVCLYHHYVCRLGTERFLVRIFSSAIRLFVIGVRCVLSVLLVETRTINDLKYPRRPPVDTGT